VNTPSHPRRGIRLTGPASPAGWPSAVGLVIWLVGIPLVHGGLPWLLSQLGPRYGWADGCPGTWNLLGLIPVAAGGRGPRLDPGLALARIGDLPERMKLDLTSPYLLTSGPYAFSRNPMYVADIVLWLGWAFFYGSVCRLGRACWSCRRSG